jgi:rhodanese-related sulfurtransferase
MRAVLVAKFMPGLSAVVSPMAGSSGVPFLRYLAFDFVGSLLYVAAYTLLGALFRNQLEVVLATIAELGQSSFLLLGSLLAMYIAFKVFERRRLIRKWRVARITADELRKKQTEGEQLMILDLRPGSELEKDPFVILGALRMAMDEVETREHEIPRDREVIVYCSCPNEISSARVASLLHRRGFVNVRPLLGGIDAWRKRDYPTDRLSPAPAITETK